MPMLDIRLYLAQRISALLLVPFVVTHLIVILIAIRGGLTVNEILGRTQGSVLWFLFYGIFVLAVSIHAAIGLRVILNEWLGLGGGLGRIAFVGGFGRGLTTERQPG